MPRIISVKRKYLPALSKALSFGSSHRGCRGSLKPAGGGPDGVAFRALDVVKVAAGVGEAILKEIGFVRAVLHCRARGSAARGRKEAIRIGSEEVMGRTGMRMFDLLEVVIQVKSIPIG